MKSSVIAHAIQNAWANPLVDNPIRLKPARLTGPRGALVEFEFKYQHYKLINNRDRFHIYSLGVYNDDSIYFSNLSRYFWTNASDIVSENPVLFTGYTDDGKIIHNEDIYFLLLEDNTIIIAVKHRKVYDIYQKSFFVRYQFNSFFSSTYAGSLNSLSFGSFIESNEDLVKFRQKLQVVKGHPQGETQIFMDGYLKPNSITDNNLVGSMMSYVYDSSIKEIHKFKLTELDTYPSSLDGGRKYLLHRLKDGINDLTLDFIDDVDFFLVDEVANQGLFIYKHSLGSARSVTHRDWGLSYDLVQFLKDITKNVDNYYIYAYVRHNGTDKKLCHSEQRINELYKLPDDKIVNYLLGKDYVFQAFNATTLEVSDYLEITRNYRKLITETDVLRGYGYSGLTKYLANPVKKLTDGNVRLDPGCNENMTVVEHDLIGNMLGYQYHISGDEYIPVDNNTVSIVQHYGKPSTEYDVHFSTDTIRLNSYHDARFFICPIIQGEPNLDWVEITGDIDKYVIDTDTGLVTWRVDTNAVRGMVVTNKLLKIVHLNYSNPKTIVDFIIPSQYGIIPEHVDIYLGDKYLTRDIDYIRKGLKVVILNTKYVTNQNAFTIICKGISTDDEKYDIKCKTGFVVNGSISTDNDYDVKDDKVFICHIDGKQIGQDAIKWQEDGLGIVKNHFNGKPYSITEAFSPLPNLVPYDGYPRRKESRIMDTSISNLFNLLKIVPNVESPSINGEYEIYSPFMSYVVGDLYHGFRTFPGNKLNDTEFSDWLSRYFSYLDYDPTRLYSEEGMQYVIVSPYIGGKVEVSSEIYTFLNRVNKLYLKDRVSLRDYVTIKTGA